MELSELRRTYPAVSIEFDDSSSIGAGRRYVFIVSFDRRHIGLYDTMGRFWKIKKEHIGRVTGVDQTVVVWDGVKIYRDRVGGFVLGMEVDVVRPPEQEEVKSGPNQSMTESIWDSGGII